MAAQRQCEHKPCGRAFAPHGNQKTCSPECSRARSRALQRTRRGRSEVEASAGRIEHTRAEVEAAGRAAMVGTLAGLWSLMEAAEVAAVEAVTRLRADGATWQELADAAGRTRTDLWKWHARHVAKMGTAQVTGLRK